MNMSTGPSGAAVWPGELDLGGPAGVCVVGGSSSVLPLMVWWRCVVTRRRACGSGRGSRSRSVTSARTVGRARSSQRGIHQFQRPSSVIVAGTRTIRTSVASSAIATAMPTPSCLTTTSTSLAKPRKTATMIAAAAEMTRPVAREAAHRRCRGRRRCPASPRGSARAGTPRSPSTGRTAPRTSGSASSSTPASRGRGRAARRPSPTGRSRSARRTPRRWTAGSSPPP